MAFVQVSAEENDVKGWPFAVASGILGWVLDAFDFFVIVFLFDTLSSHFHVSKASIVVTLTLTLAMRPVGALLFGALGDRYGRKGPLILCVVYFSTMTVLSGFAPSYRIFVLLRALYGIGMGGYWGIGASYAMESAPRRLRGFLSGLMQGGYPLGFLLASIGMQVLAPAFGWRSMFLVGALVTAIIVALTLFAPESKAWKSCRPASFRQILAAPFQHLGMFSYLLLLMSAMTCLSHGTQDLYPDFLKSVRGLQAHTILGMTPTFAIPMLFNVGAVLGALFFGHISESIGRRKSILLALGLCLLSMNAWAFGATVLTLTIGSFLMQAGVQGAIGVVPAHVNELSPDAIRSLFPGLVYQLGVLVASPAVSVEYVLRRHLGYSWALTIFELCVIGSLILIFVFGPERRGRTFYHPSLNEESLPAGAARAS